MSIESQKSELFRAFGEKDGISVVGVYEESFSAKAPGRPVFEEMLTRIERGEAEGIIAWHPDRLARNSVDGGRIIYLLDRNRLRDLRFSTFSFENNPQGKFMLSIIFGYSKYYVDNLSENVRRGNRAKIQRGWWPNRAPLGYLNDPATKTIVEDPARFPLVRSMWELMLSGNHTTRSIFQIARFDWGFRTPRSKRSGDKPLALSSVYKILNNPFYAGLLPWRGESHPGQHPPMITLAEFDRVQQLLGRRNTRRPQRKIFAYTGLIRCGECGLSITAEDHVNRYGYHYTYYRCTKKRWLKPCSQPYVEVADLESQILAFLREHSLPDRFHSYAMTRLDRARAESRDSLITQRESVARSLAATASSLDNLTRLRVRDLIDDAAFLAQREELRMEQRRLKERLERLAQPDQRLEPTQLLVSFSNRAVSWFQKGDIATKRLIVTIIGSNLTLTDKKLSIEANKPFRRWGQRLTFRALLTAVEDVRTFSEAPEFIGTLAALRQLAAKVGLQAEPPSVG